MGRSEGGQKKNQHNWCVPTARRPLFGAKGGQGCEFLRTICVHHRHGRTAPSKVAGRLEWSGKSTDLSTEYRSANRLHAVITMVLYPLGLR